MEQATVSGRRVLWQILDELISRRVEAGGLSDATTRVRAGLLTSGSSSDENHDSVSRLKWGDHVDREAQGICLTTGSVPIADILETLWDSRSAHASIANAYPALTPADIDAAFFGIWVLVSSAQMFEEHLEAEQAPDDVELAPWIQSYARHMDDYIKRRAAGDAPLIAREPGGP